MRRIAFTPEAIEALKHERMHHPHPRVQQKMWAVYLKAEKLRHEDVCRIVDISENTLRSYLDEFIEGGVEKLKRVPFHKPVSALDARQDTLEAHFRREPPASVAHAQALIADLTGIDRGPTQVRRFLHRMGMKFRKVAAVPAKADPAAQEEFKKNSWSRGWSKPKRARAGSSSSMQPTSCSRPSSDGSGALRGSSFVAPLAGSVSTSSGLSVRRRIG